MANRRCRLFHVDAFTRERFCGSNLLRSFRYCAGNQPQIFTGAVRFTL